MSVKVDVIYNNQTINSLNESGKLKYDTAGKYFENDLTVEFTGPEDATATASDILATKTAYIADGSKATGTMPNNGDVSSTITTQGGTATIPAGYTSGGTVTASITPSVLDNTIISGQAFEEATGDYAWKSTVNLPAGYHNAQTIEKTFSDVFPAPATEGTSADLRLGKQLYNHEGKLLTGTIPEKTATTYTASTSDQTISSDQYLTGVQTIKAVSLNASAGNMLAGTSASIESNGSTVTSVAGTIPTKTSADLTASGATVTAPSGYYATSVSKSVATGSLGAITASKSAVSSGTMTVTPQMAAGTAGYNAMAATSGTAVTVSTSEFTGDATADASKILSSYTAYIADGSKATGNITTWNGEKKIFLGQLCFTANTAGSTISMSKYGTPTLSQNFQTSTDGITWTEFIPGTTTITLTNVGDKVYFKGNNPNGVNESSSIYHYFATTGSVAASGNIMSLIDNGACTTTTIPNNFCFYYLFLNCGITTPPELPATTLTERCYSNMFFNCRSMPTPPVLPATTLADSCYNNMFAGCWNLLTAPTLPATTLASYCYCGMFDSCKALTTAPALPVTTLADGCYSSMFDGCTSLTTPPALPATALAESCYNGMFMHCTNLKVSDTSGSGFSNAWNIPTSGTFTNTTTQNNIFISCAGTRSSNHMSAVSGQSKTYYTQNTPV